MKHLKILFTLILFALSITACHHSRQAVTPPTEKKETPKPKFYAVSRLPIKAQLVAEESKQRLIARIELHEREGDIIVFNMRYDTANYDRCQIAYLTALYFEECIPKKPPERTNQDEGDYERTD